MLKRWPTALAVALGALLLEDVGGDETRSILAEALPMLPLVYLVVAYIQRPRLSWPTVAVGAALALALPQLDVIAPSVVFVSLALIVLVWSAASGDLQDSSILRVQALGMVGFGALALVALAVDPDLGRYLVAAGWFLHGVWDFVHLRLDKVVVSSYAEWCGVFDVIIAAELIFLT